MKLALLLAMLAVVALIIHGLGMLRYGFSARDKPSSLEAMLATGARRMAIPKSAREQVNSFRATPQILLEARRHFADHCAVCHANDGSGKTEMGQNLYPKAPDMRLDATQKLTDGELYYIVHNGIRLSGMPAWGAPGDDPDSWKLALFIHHLPVLTDAEKQDMRKYNPKSTVEMEEDKETEDFLNGKDVHPEKHTHKESDP